MKITGKALGTGSIGLVARQEMTGKAFACLTLHDSANGLGRPTAEQRKSLTRSPWIALWSNLFVLWTACTYPASADAARIVYLAEQRYIGLRELFLADTDTLGVTTQLNKPLPRVSNGVFPNGVLSFAVSPDGARVAFSADQTNVGDNDLYLVDVATPGKWTHIGDLAAGQQESYAKFSPDGSKLAFTAGHLYLVDLAKPATAIRLNGDLVQNGSVSATGFQFTPDGTHIVYVATEQQSVFELYAVDLAQPGNSVLLNAPGGSVGDSAEGRFQILPDSRGVVYAAVWQNPGVRELHIVSLDHPGQVVTLNASLQPEGDIFDFAVSPDGHYVTYTADQDTDNKLEVFLVDINIPGTATKINGPAQSNAGLARFTPNSQRIIYAGDEERGVGARDLYAVSINEPVMRSRLNAPLAPASDINAYTLSADGTQVVYRPEPPSGFATDLMLMQLNAPGTAVKINGALPGGALDYAQSKFSPDGKILAFLAVESLDDSIQELFFSRVSEPGISTRLNGTLPLGGIVSPTPDSFAFLPESPGFQINAGLNDAWYDPVTAGQGFFINVFPDIGQVFIAWFTYDTERPDESVSAIIGEPGHRWITASGPYSGDKAVLDIEITQGGVFDAANPKPTQGPGGTITLEFTHCNAGTVTYDMPSIGRQGVVPIERIALDSVPACEELNGLAASDPTTVTRPENKTGSKIQADGFQINNGLNDAWYNPLTDGQGFFMTVFPNIKQMFLGWFTYDVERPDDSVDAHLGDPGHRWMTAFGPYTDHEAVLDIEVNQGGLFDAASPAPTPHGDGTVTVNMSDCENGSITYDITSANLQGEIPIKRIALDNVPLCESL